MQRLLRYAAPAALAAALVVVFEVARTLALGDTRLGSAGQALGFALAVAGLLGLPLWLGGATLVIGADGVRGGWRWGRGDAPPPDPARVAAWVLFGLVALAVLVLGVQGATTKFVKLFRRPIYQGLGAGLVAAGIVVGLTALAGPIVGALARLLAKVRGRVPRWVDPTTARGAAAWTLAVLFGGAFLAPVLLKELHTVDLRPARLALLWGVSLVGFVAWTSRRPRGVALLITAAALAAVFGAGFGWSAASLGDSQRRLLALDRDTLLAGKVSRRLGRLGDGDGDGVPRLLAGGDCDDTDPAVRPGVYDPPGDGVDQNCTGADLVLAEDPIGAVQRDPPGERQRWHVVLVTIDAVRYDLSLQHMPELRKLAAESVEFTNAYAHSAATYWSIPALLASKMPSRLHMGRDQTPVAGEVLLTEVLRQAGYHTGLFANVTIFFVRGLRQGAMVANYDTSDFTVHGAKPGSAHMTDGLLKHVDAFQAGQLKGGDSMFLWGHYYDPHDPYFEVPEEPAVDSSDKARYEALLRYTDRHVGRLVQGLKDRGLWSKTVFVVTADHGDEFLDHGHRFHGSTLYEEMTHVPLIVHVPGVGHRSIDGPMGHIEFAPTLLDLLGIAVPGSYTGRSRADEVRTGEPAPDEPVFLEVFPDSNYAGHQVGVRLGDLKLIYRISENYFELYDLAADPKERDNVYDVHPEAPRLRALLLRYADHHLYHLARGLTGAKLPEGAPEKPAPRKRKPKRSKRK